MIIADLKMILHKQIQYEFCRKEAFFSSHFLLFSPGNRVLDLDLVARRQEGVEAHDEVGVTSEELGHSADDPEGVNTEGEGGAMDRINSNVQ